MGYVVMIAQFLLSLSFLIVLHELGHFTPAKLFKTRVEKFFLFFDVKFALFKKKIGETVYGIGWLPLGGYVKISGMIDESMDKEQMKQPPQPWEFRSKPAWQRLIIMLGGVTVNFILGFLIFGLLLWQYGEEYLPAENATYGIATDSLAQEMGLRDGDRILRIGDRQFTEFDPSLLRTEIGINNAKTITVDRQSQEMTIPVADKFGQLLTSYDYRNFSLITVALPCKIKEVMEGSPAAQAGFEADDQIISIDGEDAPFFHQAAKIIQQSKGQQLAISALRSGDTVALTPTVSEEGTIGFYPYSPNDLFETETRDYTLAAALPAGVKKGVDFLNTQIKAFGQMFRGKIKASDSLGGFVTISNLFPKTWDWQRFWYITAVLSLILGFMNLLPIPGLDGGHVMFLLWEVVTGKKPSDKFLERATTIGFLLLIILLLYANGLDIWRAIKN